MIQKILKFLFKFLISIVALYFVFKKVDTQQITELYRRTDLLYLILATGCFVLSKIISAYRFKNILQEIGILVNNKKILQLYWLGMYYNLFLPGGVGGDGYKAYLLRKNYKKPVKSIISATVIDRANGLFVLILIAGVLFSILINSQLISVLILAAIPACYLIYYLVMVYFFPLYKKIVHKINIYSFLVQAFQIILVITVLKSWNIEYHTLTYVSLFLLSSIVAILPITIGGAGARELTFLFFENYFSFDLHTAVALSLMFYLITLLVSFTGAVFVIKPIDFKETPIF
jgi:uncharacterized membrane protein YbhN (UPF0104 family)